ncbi:MAG: hypothetical protein CM15mP59_0530 [Flavobacteriaceae bacterium]|nr:MAG: hypothetical protein CM15mP59_0530 [Flavobacteriaceae bacterium]
MSVKNKVVKMSPSLGWNNCFPCQKKKLTTYSDYYAHVSDVVWAQEEPRNMGAWSHLLLHLPAAQQFRVASRRFYGTPAGKCDKIQETTPTSIGLCF